MKLLKLAVLTCMVVLLSGYADAKPPKFIKGNAKDIEALKTATSVDVKFDYKELFISKLPEKDWVSKQKQKGIDDPQKAADEFLEYWYSEVVPNQQEEFIKWYNTNCKDLFKLTKGTKSKYTIIVRPITLFPYNNFGQIAVLTADAVITETESGKELATIEIPNINAAVPALKERVSMTYAGAGKALALFLLDAYGK
jgi:hypothetical protein